MATNSQSPSKTDVPERRDIALTHEDWIERGKAALGPQETHGGEKGPSK